MSSFKAHTGNVTFLFTDIVGSTEMWEKHGDAFLPILQAHNAILSDAVERYGGHLFKEEGDAYKVAFSDPSAAVKCAILAQAALQRYPWPEDVGPLRVRMAVHSGTPFVQGNDYYGPPLNRASRILSTTHGGQILISEDTFQHVEHRMESGTGLLDQGFHQLRDLDTQLRLYQVSHPALQQTSFPPPRSMNGHAHNLPAQRRSFIGREKEIGRIASQFTEGDTRLLTLTGPEGIGKTRLAIQASAEYIHLFPDGVWVVSLTNAVDLVGAAIEIADAMSIPIPPGKPALETVREYLARRSCLLILDDIGHMPQADRLIRELLTGTASLRCLATSRNPIATIEGEQLPIPDLTAPPEDATPQELLASEAGSLFVDRIHEKREDFELTKRNAPTISRLLNKMRQQTKLQPGPIEKYVYALPPTTLTALDQFVSKGATLGKQAVAQGREALEKVKKAPEVAAIQKSIAAAVDSENPAIAESKWQQALTNYQGTGNKEGIAVSLRQLGLIAIRRKEFSRAYTLLSAAHQLYIEMKSPESMSVRLDVDAALKGLGHNATGHHLGVDDAIGIAMGD